MTESEIKELQNAEEGTIVVMGCRNCEGGEEHKKVGDSWVCQWCYPD